MATSNKWRSSPWQAQTETECNQNETNLSTPPSINRRAQTTQLNREFKIAFNLSRKPIDIQQKVVGHSNGTCKIYRSKIKMGTTWGMGQMVGAGIMETLGVIGVKGM